MFGSNSFPLHLHLIVFYTGQKKLKEVSDSL